MIKSIIGFFSLHWDLAGFATSFLCAIHCMAWPFLLSLPAFGSSFLADMPWLETLMIVAALLIALAVLGHGHFRGHHRRLPLILALLGFLCILLGRTFFFDWEQLLTVLGSLLVAGSHFLNWRLSRICTSPSP